MGRLAGQPDPEPVRAQGKGAQARHGAEAEAIGFIRLELRISAAGALYLVCVAIFQVAGQRFCIADSRIAERFAPVQSIQARRPGTLAPGSANREGLVQPVLARDLIGERCSDIVVIVAPPGEDDIPIAVQRQGRFRERRPAPALARGRVAGGTEHVARFVGSVDDVPIVVNILPVLVCDLGARRPPRVTAAERECRSVKGCAGRLVVGDLIAGQPEPGLANGRQMRGVSR